MNGFLKRFSSLTVIAFFGCVAVPAYAQQTTKLKFSNLRSEPGVDTGLSIDNQSTVNGVCEITYHDIVTEADLMSKQVSITAGDIWVALLSEERRHFNGYMIAKCNFPGARGYALTTRIDDEDAPAIGFPAEVLKE